MDKIIIDNLTVFSNHGVYPEENVLGQKFVFSAVLSLDTRKAGRTDALENSVNYGEVCAFITEFSRSHTFKLLEALAESLAEEILLRYELVRGVRLKVMKPWAPVGLPVDNVGIEIERSRHEAFIALGSNMGDSRAFLDGAVEGIRGTKGCTVEAVSDYLVTKPYGGVEQDDFLNGVMKITTLMTPEELLDRLHELEQEANRVRLIHWGPRTLDLDIIFYDDIVLDTPNLHIPHIDMARRDFVLKPMCDIAPYYRHPILQLTMQELLDRLEER